VKTVTVPVIKTDEDLKTAIDMLAEVFDAAPESEEFAKAETLAILIQAYEQRNHPIFPPEPVAAIRFAVEQRGYSKARLAEIMGGAPRLSEVLNGRRRLSLNMIRRLHKELQIPLESLVGFQDAWPEAPRAPLFVAEKRKSAP
jgi:HTH-type transcriptional regulator / antitoxin HigA